MQSPQQRIIRKVEYHLHTDDFFASELDVIVLRGVVYEIKRRGPRTDP
jgi:hypothetical protein